MDREEPLTQTEVQTLREWMRYSAFRREKLQRISSRKGDGGCRLLEQAKHGTTLQTA